MDFSILKEAIASNSYGKIADICDDLMLQVAADGVAFQEEWPYAIHLLGHIYANDVNSARYLWKSIPSSIKESQAEVVAAWKIGQQLWVRDYAGVYEAIRGFDWSSESQGLVSSFSELYTNRMFQLLLSAYSTISIGDTALFLGMNEEDATNYSDSWRETQHEDIMLTVQFRSLYHGDDLHNALQHGWVVDPASGMLTVKKQPVATEQKLDHSKLQRLTEYVFHLEH